MTMPTEVSASNDQPEPTRGTVVLYFDNDTNEFIGFGVCLGESTVVMVNLDGTLETEGSPRLNNKTIVLSAQSSTDMLTACRHVAEGYAKAAVEHKHVAVAVKVCDMDDSRLDDLASRLSALPRITS